jgi:hypothetical protein
MLNNKWFATKILKTDYIKKCKTLNKDDFFGGRE